MSPSEPPIRISEPRASRYEFDTHCCAASPPPRSRSIAGRATLTIVPSIIATPDPRIAATRVSRWRRVTRERGPGGTTRSGGKPSALRRGVDGAASEAEVAVSSRPDRSTTPEAPAPQHEPGEYQDEGRRRGNRLRVEHQRALHAAGVDGDPHALV